MKPLPNSMACRLVSLKKYKDFSYTMTHIYTRTHTEVRTELEPHLVNPESFVMALRLSVIQSPVTWVSLSVYVCRLFSLLVNLFPSQCHIKPCYTGLCFSFPIFFCHQFII